MTALAMRSVVYGQYLELQSLIISESTYEDSKVPVTQLCKIRRMPLGNPRTGLRHELKCVTSRIRLSIPHELNRYF
jgi:hypothetical protein